MLFCLILFNISATPLTLPQFWKAYKRCAFLSYLCGEYPTGRTASGVASALEPSRDIGVGYWAHRLCVVEPPFFALFLRSDVSPI